MLNLSFYFASNYYSIALYILHYMLLLRLSRLKCKVFTWMSDECQSDSYSANERARGYWEKEAAAAIAPAGCHLVGG